MTKKKLNRTLLAVLVFALIMLLSVSVQLFPKIGSQSSSVTQRHLGFWIDERDMWSGSGLNWNPQTFVNNYFLTSPYPSAMIFATGPSQIGGYMNTKAQPWLDQVANLADQYANVQIIVLVFINMSDPTQVSEFQSFSTSLSQYPSVIGFEYEREYYGNTVAINQQFCNIVQSSGKICIIDPLMESYFSGPVLDYSTYPYYGGTIPTSPPAGSRSLGVGYGETGACSSSTSTCADGMPVVSTYGLWTQSVVTSIVNTSPSSAFTFLYSDVGTGINQYAGIDSLWNNPILRGWIWSDSFYQSNYALSTTNVCNACTTMTTTQTTSQITSVSQTTATASTTSQSVTSSATTTQGTTSPNLSPSTNPFCVISNSNPSVGDWVSITCSGFPSQSSVEAVVFNNSTNSYAAYLFPGSTSSTGTLSFSMKVTTTMPGADDEFFYSPETLNNPIASVPFTTGSTPITSTNTTTNSTTSTAIANLSSSSGNAVSTNLNTSTSSSSSSAQFASTLGSQASTVTTTSLTSQVTVSSTGGSSSTITTVSSSTNTNGHNGHPNVQNTPQKNGQTNAQGGKKSTTNTTSSITSGKISISSPEQGISSIFAPSTLSSMFASSGNPPVAYAFATYEITLIGGLATFLGAAKKSRKYEAANIRGWRW